MGPKKPAANFAVGDKVFNNNNDYLMVETENLKKYLGQASKSFITLSEKDQAKVGGRLKELLHTVTDGAFVPLMNCCLEECHMRKLCALKGIVTDELSSSLQLKVEDVKKEGPKEEPKEEPMEEPTDSDVDERMAEADADIEAEVWNTRDEGHGNNKEESECAPRPTSTTVVLREDGPRRRRFLPVVADAKKAEQATKGGRAASSSSSSSSEQPQPIKKRLRSSQKSDPRLSEANSNYLCQSSLPEQQNPQPPSLLQPTPVLAPMASLFSAATKPQQKVQIVRCRDGKIQVRGLLPGQKLVQMPDGKLQIFTNPNVSPGATIPSPQQQKQVVAQQLPPGAPMPPGHTAFVSGGKTYTIPKSVTAGATGIQIQKLAAPAMPGPPTITPVVPPSPVVPSLLPTNAATPTMVVAAPKTPGGKQVMEVKSLGQNSVTFKETQMIVSGPNMAQVQAITMQLSTGQARLASYNGKQVLILLTTAQPAAPEPRKPPVQVTAQMLLTAEGPRIVLQGIQGSNLPKEDLATIQEQVKNQLLKAQAEAKQQNKVPPTKIVIDLPQSIQAKLQFSK